MACPWHAPIGLPCAWGVGATQTGVTGIAWNRPFRRCQNRCACARYMHASMNIMHATSIMTLNESIRTPKSMYGACHAMPQARAMPCGGGSNSGGGCRKTPDFGLVEGRRSPLKACKHIQLQRARAHAALCPYQARLSHFLQDGGKEIGGIGGGLGVNT